MRRLAILAVVGLWFPVVGLLCTAGCNRGDIPGNIGKPAPAFTVTDGVNTVELSKLRGHVVSIQQGSGARFVARTIARHVTTPLSEAILRGRLASGHTAWVHYDGNAITVEAAA